MKKLLLSTVSVMAFVSAATAQANTAQTIQPAKENAFVIDINVEQLSAKLDMATIVSEQAKSTLELGKAKYLNNGLLAYQPVEKPTKAPTVSGE